MGCLAWMLVVIVIVTTGQGVSVDETSGLTGMADDGTIYADVDLRLSKKQYDDLHGKSTTRPSDEGYIQPIVLWPGGLVPFEISTTDFSAKERFEIRSGLTEIEKYTCITFRPKTPADSHYLSFIKGPGGCSSELGLVKNPRTGNQEIYLNTGACRNRGTYIHETLHALGVIHEHQNWMRDDWIDIIKVNIRDGQQEQFEKYTQGSYERKGVDYSYHSIMHYSTKALSFDRFAPTIKAKDPSNNKYMGQRKGLAYSDVELVNKLYRCAKQCPNPTKCGSTGHLDQHCECICKDGSQDCDSTKTPAGVSCTNTHDIPFECYRLAAEGKCQSSKDWMSKNCARACGCGDDGGIATGGGSGPLVDDEDAHTCTFSTDHFSCSYGRLQMGCKKSCAEIAARPCVDLGDGPQTCSSIKANGQCNTFEGKYYCRLTCGRCNDIYPDGKPPSAGSCTDTHTKCAVMKGRGECEVSPYWMGKHCPKTCGYCGGWRASTSANSCGNRDNNCQRWALSGHCRIRQSEMKRDCPGACNDC